MHVRASADEAEPVPARGYSIEEAAKRIGIGRSMAYELMATGQLESIQIGRRRIIPESAIREFMARKLAASRAERHTQAV